MHGCFYVGLYFSLSVDNSTRLSRGHLLTNMNKKLSYRRETARQLLTWRGLGPPAHSPSTPSGSTHACKGVDCLHYITCCIYCIVGLSMAGIV